MWKYRLAEIVWCICDFLRNTITCIRYPWNASIASFLRSDRSDFSLCSWIAQVCHRRQNTSRGWLVRSTYCVWWKSSQKTSWCSELYDENSGMICSTSDTMNISSTRCYIETASCDISRSDRWYTNSLRGNMRWYFWYFWRINLDFLYRRLHSFYDISSKHDYYYRFASRRGIIFSCHHIFSPLHLQRFFYFFFYENYHTLRDRESTISSTRTSYRGYSASFPSTTCIPQAWYCSGKARRSKWDRLL